MYQVLKKTTTIFLKICVFQTYIYIILTHSLQFSEKKGKIMYTKDVTHTQ